MKLLVNNSVNCVLFANQKTKNFKSATRRLAIILKSKITQMYTCPYNIKLQCINIAYSSLHIGTHGSVTVLSIFCRLITLRCLRESFNPFIFRCPYENCSYRCKFNSNLKRHIKRIHESEKPFKVWRILPLHCVLYYYLPGLVRAYLGHIPKL